MPGPAIRTTPIRSGLGRLVIKSLIKFGPLTIDQLVELIECENSTYKFGPNFSLLDQVQKCVSELISLTNYLDYDTNTGKFSIPTSSNCELSENYSINQIVGTESFTRFKPSEMRFEKIGYGSEYVYVVYSKTMRLEAILKSKELWPLKVGKTNNLQRRIVQLSESGPNSLTIGLVMRSDNPMRLEKAIHNKLIKNGQACQF